MAGTNGRTPEQVRRDIEAERERLADAVDDLRSEMDVNAKLQGKLPLAAAAALGAGFVSPAGSERRCDSSCAAAGRAGRRHASARSPLSTATETDEGRAPSSPLQLSWREWLAVFKRTGKQFIADDCLGLGQQVAFSSLFAFFPTVILLIGLLGLFGDRAFDSLEHFVGSVAPHGVISTHRPRQAGRCPQQERLGHRLRGRPVPRLVGRDRRDERADQGGQPRVRPDRDTALLEAAADRARARGRDRLRARRSISADRLRR